MEFLLKKIILPVFVICFIMIPLVSNSQDEVPTLIPVIKTGDTIVIEVHREEGLSDEYLVDRNGFIDIGLIGKIKAEGLSLRTFQKNLEKELNKYIRDPRIKTELIPKTVVPGGGGEEETGYTVFLMGQIRNPGVFNLTDSTNILQIVARAGGVVEVPVRDRFNQIISQPADPTSMVLLRATGESFPVNLEKILKGDQSQNYILEPGDVLYIPSGTARTIQVLGAVFTPGQHSINEPINLLQALTLAGGFTDMAAYKKVKIVRADPKNPETFEVNLGKIFASGKLEQMPMVQAGDVIFVPKSLFFHWKRFVGTLKDAAMSSESIRAIRDFDERSDDNAYYRY